MFLRNSMNQIPTVALIGRPNVGKSAVFNRICGKRKAIVDSQEGVTRDRVYEIVEHFGASFRLIDTGGLFQEEDPDFADLVSEQTFKAIEEADVLVQVVDGPLGLSPHDKKIAIMVQKKGKPLILAVNKIDQSAFPEEALADFYSLGIETMHAVSAFHGRSIAELIESCIEALPQTTIFDAEQGIAVALIGRPNMGKSTLLNALIHEKRALVSPVAGTTRDPIDVVLEYQKQKLIFIDTAGIRRKKAEHAPVDKFASMRTHDVIQRADVCVLMIDAREGMTTQEKHIAHEVESEGKSLVIVVNKWDLVKGFRMEHCRKALHMDTPFLMHCPIHFISAKFGRNIEELLSSILHVSQEREKRITTGQLNRFVEKAVLKNHPPMIQGKRLRIYYMTQVKTSPPAFVLFINDANRLSDSYKRYLINQFRKEFGFDGTPLVFYTKEKKKTRNSAGVKEELIHW